MRFPLSDHCNGQTFFNPLGPSERGLLDVLRWKFTSKVARWPARVALKAPAFAPAEKGRTVATWIGHSTFLLQLPEGNFLTDPVFSERCSPFTWIGPRRVHPPGIALEALPRIDGIFLSHDHFDHCDSISLRALALRDDPVVYAPLGHRGLLGDFSNVIELDWWQTHTTATGLHLTLTPTLHWSRRSLGSTNTRLWGGFFLKSPAQSLYFLGDSAYCPGYFNEIAARCGPPDLAFIPIGAYEPRWFMRSAHMNPLEAAQVHLDLRARTSVAMHWGTFQLTDEARDEPPQRLAQALSEKSISPGTFRVLEPGESIHL